MGRSGGPEPIMQPAPHRLVRASSCNHARAWPRWHGGRLVRALVAPVAVCLPLVFAGSALAAPQWAISIHAENPYGVEGSVDPFSTSPTSFDRLSGDNTYEIEVKNAGSSAVKNAPAQPVTVRDVLPEGLEAAGEGEVAAGQPTKHEVEEGEDSGWAQCKVETLEDKAHEAKPRVISCTRHANRSELQPGATYEPIKLHVYVEGNAQDSVTNSVTVSGGEASPASESAMLATEIAPAVPFGIFNFTQLDSREGGEAETLAGGHPFKFTTAFTFNFTTNFQGKLLGTGGGPNEFGVGPKEVQVELPPGMIGDPQNTRGVCPLQTFLHAHNPGEGCPEQTEAQVGFIHFDYTEGSVAQYVKSGGAEPFEDRDSSPIFNVAPPPGKPAAFGFYTVLGESGGQIPLLIFPKLRSDGDYGLTVGSEATGPLRHAEVTFCGFGAVEEGVGGALRCKKAASGEAPFLSNPVSCVESPRLRLGADPYPSGDGEPSGFAFMEAFLNGPSGPPASADHPSRGAEGPAGSSSLTGCDKLPFAPKLSFEREAGTAAGAPSGMTFQINRPGTEVNPKCSEEHGVVQCPPIASDLKNLSLTLPQGVTLSPASAAGLTACQNAEFGLGTEFKEEAGHRVTLSEPAQEAHCPLSAQIGTVEVSTPDLPKESDESGQLKGALYVGQPECAVCSETDAEHGALFRLFLQLTDKKAGLVLKLIGKAIPDPATGRVTTVFEEQPQLPFERFVLHLKGGPRATLANPQSCASSEQSVAQLTSWSSETLTEALQFTPEPECPGGVPFAPSFTAGTQHPAAGQYSNFSLTMSRGQGAEANLKGLEVHMPPGLTAKIAGVPQCGEAQASAGTCSPESQIGTVTVGVGPGPHPYFEQGRVYLTGPYGGGPFGLSIVVPTTAGPFTLESKKTHRGEEVVRAAILVDEKTSAVTVRSDPLPAFIDGVPLEISKLNVNINRVDSAHNPNFELNPTNCAPQREGITATLSSVSGAARPASTAFDVGGCGALAFKPSLTATTKAKTSRTEGASLIVKVAQRSGEAHIRKTDLQLPGVLPSRLSTLQHACTEAEFAANVQGKDCPVQSFVGTAKAETPLLDVPLSGPAILVSHGGEAFPDLHFILEGEGVRIDLVGHTEIHKGITYSRFEEVPDAPITSFETTLPEGPHSLLSANGNLCSEKLAMPTTIVGQNGAQLTQQTKVAVKGCPLHPGLTRAQKLHRALKKCRARDRKHKQRRIACERRARRRYGKRAKASDAGAVHNLLGLTGAATAGTAGSGSAASTGAGAQDAIPATGGGCPNEALRAESQVDPATGRPYSQELSECRAYELVSPLDKQGHDAEALTAVAPGGDGVGFTSQGDFAEPGNFFEEGAVVRNPYVARRVESGCPGGASACWKASSAFAPAGVIETPNLGAPLASDFGPDLGPAKIACGLPPAGDYACAVARPDSSWVVTPTYWPTEGLTEFRFALQADLGESADLSRVFFEPRLALLPQDFEHGGLYELSGLQAYASGGAAPRLRLVNVEGPKGEVELGQGAGGKDTPLLGDSAKDSEGTADHAVSRSGNDVFFTAVPSAGKPQAVFARVPCTGGAECEFLEAEGHKLAGTGRETIDLSAPECEGACSEETPHPALFQGASAEGSIVFFTTSQELLPQDKDATNDLYAYDFAAAGPHKLLLLSRGNEGAGGDPSPGNGAEVKGVVRNAADGSRVYFVAGGVLTEGANSFGKKALVGADNLYEVDTATDKVAFVATLPPADEALWGRGCGEAGIVSCDNEAGGLRRAGLTPDGRDLVFDTHAQLDPRDANGCTGGVEGGVHVCSAQAVYRYDAQTGALTWVSHGAPGFGPSNKASNSLIVAPNGSKGAMAVYADLQRAISGCGEEAVAEAVEGCAAKGEHDGEDVVFSTGEPLQAGDVNGAEDVYLWHCSKSCQENPEGEEGEGTVSLISGGAKQTSAQEGVLSASGRDVFFRSNAALVAADTDELVDVYDARIDGGIPLLAPPSCVGEACQGPLASEPTFSPSGSSIFSGGQNLASPASLAAAAPVSAVKRRGPASSARSETGRKKRHPRPRRG